MSNWVRKSCDTFTARIYIAGNYTTIQQVCAEFCENGFCVSVQPCSYIYKYGQEEGAEVTIINYPRFPETNEQLFLKAEKLGFKIADRCNQGSFTIQSDNETVFHSRCS